MGVSSLLCLPSVLVSSSGLQNELQNPSWEPPRHPLGHPCEHNLQFVQICSILGVPRCPQSSQTEPRWVPKSNKIKQKLLPETSSEKATRHTVFEDAFQAEFTQNLEGPPRENTAIYCTGAMFSHPRSRASFVNFCCPKG